MGRPDVGQIVGEVGSLEPVLVIDFWSVIVGGVDELVLLGELYGVFLRALQIATPPVRVSVVGGDALRR